jgi:peroxiredoxin (alkyl hydroperoxide reductase subunit C)
MTCDLQPGDKVEFGIVYRINEYDLHISKPISEIVEGKRLLIYGGPAPFGKLDTEQSMGYAAASQELLAHVDEVLGIYCQDSFVMKQFDLHIKNQHPNHGVTFWADGDGFFIRNLRLEHDFTYSGLSVRSIRYAMIVNNGVIEHIVTDDYQLIDHTSTENILNWLKNN